MRLAHLLGGRRGLERPARSIAVAALSMMALLQCEKSPLTSGSSTVLSFARLSADGRYVMFASDMNGAGRTEVFLAEVPTK